MPRKGRIDMVDEFESHDAEARADELRELAAELHREWREREPDWADDEGDDAQEPAA